MLRSLVGSEMCIRDRPNDDTIWDMQQACQTLIKESGFKQYEVSAYAKDASTHSLTPTLASQHNLNYWRFGDYLAIGAGAHGKVTLSDGTIHRTMKPKHPRQYLEDDVNHTFQNISTVEKQDRAFEFFLNRLRLTESFPVSHFEQTTGLEFATIESHINQALTNKWLAKEAAGYKVTELGLQFLNNLQSLFLPE